MPQVRERKFIYLAASAVLFLNLLPYFFQNRITPPNKVYVGSYPILLDKPVYLSFMVQGMEGNWAVVNRYTTEVQKPKPLYLIYIVLGHIAAWLNISAESMFFITRFFFGALLVCTIIYFVRYFVLDALQRKIAILLTFFSSGIGWVVGNRTSLDYWLPDAIPMVRFLHFPHIIFAHILLLWSFLCIRKALDTKKIRYAMCAGITSVLLHFIVPFHSLLFFVIVCLLFLFEFIKNPLHRLSIVKTFTLFFAISLPFFLYIALLGLTDPVWSLVEKQNKLLLPHVLWILFGYPLLLLSPVGFYFMLKKNNPHTAFFIFWMLAALIFSYLPLVPMQRRFLETAFYIPLAIVASYACRHYLSYIKKWITPLISMRSFLGVNGVALIIIFLFGGIINNWIEYQRFVSKFDDTHLYLPRQNIEAMAWLQKNTNANSVILSSYSNGNIIPAISGKYVYVGHGPSTLYLEQKVGKVNDFYSSKYTQDQMIDFLQKERIDFIFFSDQERISDNFQPQTFSFLKEVYHQGGVFIYRVLL